MVDFLDYTDTLLESEVQLQISKFPSGNRDFTLMRSGAAELARAAQARSRC